MKRFLLSNYKNIFLLIFALLLAGMVKGQETDRYAVASGNWNSTSTWATAPYGSPGASVPGVNNDVFIVRDNTVTVTANVSCKSLTFSSVTTGNLGNLIVNGGVTLTVTSALTMNSGKTSVTAFIEGAGTINCSSLIIGIGTTASNNGTFYHTLTSTINELTISGNIHIFSRLGNNQWRFNDGVFSHLSGNVTVMGSITTTNEDISTTSSYVMGDSSPTLNLGGANPFILSGIGTNVIMLDGTGATVNYNGPGDQSVIGTYPYDNLTLSVGGTKTFSSATTVHSKLSISSGVTANLGAYSSTANTMSIGGVGVTNGSWGSSNSNPVATYQNDDYFALAASGLINISTSTCVTPAAPATTGALICIGSTATLTASGAGPSSKYKWYDAVSGSNLLRTSTSHTNNTFVTSNLTASTDYWVSVMSLGGCESARIQVTATHPVPSADSQTAAGTNTWIGHVYKRLDAVAGPPTDPNAFTRYYGWVTEPETFNESFGGPTSCFPVTASESARSVYAEYFAVRYRMTSTKKGLYVVDLGSDDGGRLTVDGALIYNNWTEHGYAAVPRVLMNLKGPSSLVYDFYESSGSNQIVFQNLNLVIANTLSTNATQNICLGNSGLAISGDVYGTLPTGISLSGTGYQWTYSTSPSGTRINISGATGATFTPNTTVAPFNAAGTYYIFRNAVISSTNNVVPNLYVASNESNGATIIVTKLPVATFSYIGAPYCKNASNPSPTFSGEGVAGSFSSAPEGLNFVSTATGQVNLTTSAAGTYTVTNTIAASGGCDVVTATSPVTIIAGGSWTGILSTDWNNPGNWACNQLPTLATNVTIANGKPHYPTLSGGVEGAANSLIIESAGSLIITGNTLQIAGAISNGGSFNASAGTIEMKGTAAQTIFANTFTGDTIMSLRVNNPAGVTLEGALDVTGIVTALNGNLTSEGKLTLVSTAARTALIDGIGTGDVLGNVTMQRYMPSAFGYKYVSSPFQAATVAQFSPEVDLTASFPRFYKYDENNSDPANATVYTSGWVKYNTPGNLLIPMKGYAANYGAPDAASTFIVDLTGVVNNGDLQMELVNHHREFTQGFHLVGNPYPSPINWNAPGWTKTNIDGGIHFFNASGDQYSGTYSSYVGGISTDVGDNIIGAMQGFFVHVSTGNPLVDTEGILKLNNSVRVNNLNPVFKRAIIDNRSILRFTAKFDSNNALKDAAVIYFDNAANLDFDRELDALKMTNTDLLVPNIYSLTPELNQLSINGMPKPSDELSKIPLGITTFTDGWVTLTADDISRLPADLHIYLLDAETGLQRNLQQVPDYRFYLKSGQYNGRFSLVFSQSELLEQVGTPGKLFTLLRSGDYLSVKANLPDNTRGSLMVTNLLGQIILRREVSGNETLEINPTAHTGVYVITLVSGKFKHSEKVIMRKDYE